MTTDETVVDCFLVCPESSQVISFKPERTIIGSQIPSVLETEVFSPTLTIPPATAAPLRVTEAFSPV